MTGQKLIPIAVAAVVTAGEIAFSILTEFMLERIIIDGFLVSMGWIIPRLLNDLKFRKEFADIMNLDRKVADIPNQTLKSNVKTYMDNAIGDLDALITDIRNGVAELDDQQYARFVKIVFKTRQRYDAVDVTLPSLYEKKNPGYLAAHAEALRHMRGAAGNGVGGDGGMGCRIILRDSTELGEDSKFERFSKFWQWHADHDVDLRYLPMTRARAIIGGNGMEPSDCELGMGVWGDEFAILFGRRIDADPESAEPRRTRIKIVGGNRAEFGVVKRICVQMIGESETMMRDATPKILAQKMVDMWRDYVNPEKRWQTIRPFVYHFFDRYRREERRIIDIAAGMGVEYYYMMRDGFDISANEVQDELKACGERYRRDNGYDTEYKPSDYSWLKMDTAPDRGRFYGLLATGNSLRMLGTAKAQGEALRQFGGMMRPGGTLMVDERNYWTILKNADRINELGRNRDDRQLFADLNRTLHRIPNPLYHGTNIGGIPYSVDTDGHRVSFCYYENVGVINTLREAEEHKIQDWEFRHDRSMEDLLADAGFVDIEKYADFDLDKRIELNQDTDEASMYVFVARKPV